MSLVPLTSASAVIQLHAWAAMLALVLGAAMMLGRKGTRIHRWIGRVWVVGMLASVLSSFFIHELRTWGPWSPIHLLSVITVVLVVRAYRAIRQRKVQLHAEIMKVAFYNALLLATFFTFLPGRIMHEVVFGPSADASSAGAIPQWVWITIGVVGVTGGRHLWMLLARKSAAAGSVGEGQDAA